MRLHLASLGAGVAQGAGGAVRGGSPGTITLHASGTLADGSTGVAGDAVPTWSDETSGTQDVTGAFVTDTLGRINRWVDNSIYGGVKVDVMVPPSLPVTVLLGLQGPMGPTGIQGPAGVAGGTGPTGAQGIQGIAGAGSNFRGAYNAGTTYATGDSVSQSGLGFVSQVNGNVGNDPNTQVNAANFTNWLPMTPSTIALPVTFSPGVTTANPINLVVPNLDGVTGNYGLKVTDTAVANGTPMIRLDHSGIGTTSGGNPSYAFEIRNLNATNGSAFVIHDYSTSTPGQMVIWDETGSNSFLMLRNAQNNSANPGSHGTGAYLDLRGYFTFADTFTDGVVAGTNLQSTSATFAAEDAGKNFIVNGTQVIASTFVDAHNMTLNTAPGNGSALTFKYNITPKQMATFDQKLIWTNLSGGTGAGTPFTFTTSAAASAAVVITQPTGGSISAVALKITQASAAIGINLAQTGAATGMQIVQTGAATALVITQSQANQVATFTQSGANTGMTITMNAGATGFYGLAITGYTHGANITTSQDSGVTLTAAKSSAGAGTVVNITNAGTGDSLKVAAGTVMLRINSTGVAWFNNAPVAQQAAGIGTNFTANAGTAMNSLSTSTGGTGASAYVYADIVRALKNYGLLAA